MNVNEVRQADTGRVAVHEIDNAARMAALRCWSQMLPMDERYELAWEAIAEAIAGEESRRLRFNELIQCGIEAIDSESRHWLRHHGRTNGRAFGIYWAEWIQTESLFEGTLCDRIALAQVMSALPERMRRSLIALAIADDLRGAAELLGQHYDTVSRNVREGRALVFSMWFGDEGTTLPRRDRRVESYSQPRAQFCKEGHEMVPENTYRVGWRGRTCRECQINRQANRRAEIKARRIADANKVKADRRRRHGAVAVKA